MKRVIPVVLFAGSVVVIVGAVLATGDVVPPAVPEIWRSSGAAYAESDSPAVCRLAGGEVRVFVTMKGGDRVDVFDAINGRHICSLGKTGGAVGEFRYPNGIAVIEPPGQADGAGLKSNRPILAVVERDNARVQCFFADDLRPAGIFGAGQLRKPYGIAVSYRGGQTTVFITDAKGADRRFALAFRLRWDAEGAQAELVHAFGDREGTGRVDEPESVVVDDRNGRILFCDEDALDVKVYSIDGRFTGTTFADGLVQGEPEGLVLLDRPKGGWVILTDQRSSFTVWHVFNREDYRHLGSFTGEPTIANTDGICVFPAAFGPFKAGALIAVHDDADIRAYDLADVVKRIERESAAKTAR